MSKLLVASNNQGKVVEIQALLEDLAVELITPAQLGLTLQVDEKGMSYKENAALKGLAFSGATGLLTMADDSGLEVEVLGGAPGIHSARFSTKPGASDADRRAYLLEQLREKSRPWQARFHCTIALANPAGEVLFAEGNCDGEIIPDARGNNGFGYDPIFFIPDLGHTMAELNIHEKNRISHRARAVRAVRPILIEMLNF
jgi:XTP/dITP diphosphohydrolase